MKKFFALLLAAICLGTCAAAQSFSDVTEKTSGHEAIGVLSDQGIITGFPDGTFRPDDSITRAESAAVIVRMAGYATDDTASVYSDVADAFWGKSYIMAATREGVLNGMGNGLFAPQDKVTYGQIVKMLVCCVGGEELAAEKGGWPKGYVDAAEELGIINNLQHYIISSVINRPAPRADVAKYVYATLTKLRATGVTVAGQTYVLGQPGDKLPAADEVLPSTAGFMWYVYGTRTYQDFHAVGVKDGKVVAIGAEGTGFTFNGYGAGDIMPEYNDLTEALRWDKHDNNKIHGVLLLEDPLWEYYTEDHSPEALHGEARMNFHCTNAYRLMHGKSVLQWSEPCAAAAQLHSQDMANQNYFQHDSLDGRKFYVRLQAQGVNYSSCAENIYAGQNLGFSMHDGWVNSLGHRKNILSNQLYLGVAGGYNETSQYKVYFTQDFFKP